MSGERVELLNLCGADDPVHRMKHLALIRHLPEIDFVAPAEDAPPPVAVLVRTVLRADPPPALLAHLTRRRRHSVVMMHLPDFLPRHEDALKVFDPLIDVYLVATPEMRDFVAAFTPCRVEVLSDPIDFQIAQPYPRPAAVAHRPLRLMWFGYPESFTKSMTGYLPTLRALIGRGEIEFHLVTRNAAYGQVGFAQVHAYDPATFVSMSERFDACLLSHQPFDFLLPTWTKSENKAVLSIALGLPVAASRTPAYARLLTGLGLQDFLFSSHAELIAVLRRLTDPGIRAGFLRASQRRVLADYGAPRIAQRWRTLLREAQARKFAAHGASAIARTDHS